MADGVVMGVVRRVKILRLIGIQGAVDQWWMNVASLEGWWRIHGKFINMLLSKNGYRRTAYDGQLEWLC